ncbi:MAG: hypothetical protein H0U73_03645 [Tatlockia sp.]|nr:hypothetical protein [Tatlockia sp.]
MNKAEKTAENINEAEGKIRLRAVFAGLAKNKYQNANPDYLAYLNDGAATKDISTWHKEFLTEFLQEQKDVSVNRNFLTRWLGFEGHLNGMLSNQNYLLMFAAMTSIHGENIPPAEMAQTTREAAVTLLTKYLDHSWFI